MNTAHFLKFIEDIEIFGSIAFWKAPHDSVVIGGNAKRAPQRLDGVGRACVSQAVYIVLQAALVELGRLLNSVVRFRTRLRRVFIRVDKCTTAFRVVRF